MLVVQRFQAHLLLFAAIAAIKQGVGLAANFLRQRLAISFREFDSLAQVAQKLHEPDRVLMQDVELGHELTVPALLIKRGGRFPRLQDLPLFVDFFHQLIEFSLPGRQFFGTFVWGDTQVVGGFAHGRSPAITQA
ncbi:hypothetical protein D3C81_1760990 [compost metagenome]